MFLNMLQSILSNLFFFALHVDSRNVFLNRCLKKRKRNISSLWGKETAMRVQSLLNII